jgi:hypothetical protein
LPDCWIYFQLLNLENCIVIANKQADTDTEII